MTIITCDRCGKQLEPKDRFTFGFILSDPAGNATTVEQGDLCVDCMTIVADKLKTFKSF